MTIGQIQDLYEYIKYAAFKKYITEEVVQDYIESQNWKTIKRIKDFQELHYPQEFEWDVAGLMP